MVHYVTKMLYSTVNRCFAFNDMHVMRVLFNCDYLKFQNLEEDANWIQGSAIHQFVIISLLITKHMFNTPKVIAYYKKPLSHPLGFFAIKYHLSI